MPRSIPTAGAILSVCAVCSGVGNGEMQVETLAEASQECGGKKKDRLQEELG